MPFYHKYNISYEHTGETKKESKVKTDSIERDTDKEYIEAFMDMKKKEEFKKTKIPKTKIEYERREFTKIPRNGKIIENSNDENLSGYGIHESKGDFDEYENFERGECTNDIVHIVWSGDVQEGFIHEVPFEIPRNCFLVLKFNCQSVLLLEDHPEIVSEGCGISVPSLNNAKGFISNVMPIETDTDIFFPLRIPEGTIAYFKRDVTAKEYEKIYELALKCWKISDAEGEAMMNDRVQMH